MAKARNVQAPCNNAWRTHCWTHIKHEERTRNIHCRVRWRVEFTSHYRLGSPLNFIRLKRGAAESLPASFLGCNRTISWWYLNCAVSNATCASRRASSAIVARNDTEHKDAVLLHDYASNNICIIIRLAAPKHAYLYRMYVPWTFHPVLVRNLRLLIVGYTLIHGCYASLNVSHTVLGRFNRSMIGTLSFLMRL